MGDAHICISSLDLFHESTGGPCASLSESATHCKCHFLREAFLIMRLTEHAQHHQLLSIQFPCYIVVRAQISIGYLNDGCGYQTESVP